MIRRFVVPVLRDDHIGHTLTDAGRLIADLCLVLIVDFENGINRVASSVQVRRLLLMLPLFRWGRDI